MPVQVQKGEMMKNPVNNLEKPCGFDDEKTCLNLTWPRLSLREHLNRFEFRSTAVRIRKGEMMMKTALSHLKRRNAL